MNTTTINKTISRRFYDEVINERKFHLIDELVSESFVDHNPEPGQPTGRAGVAPMFKQFVDAFPDLTARVDLLVADGDRVGAYVTMTGTHLGTFNGAEPTGRKVEVTGFDWARIQDGKIAERWGVFDMAGMLKQLDLVPGLSNDDHKQLSKRYYAQLDKTRGDIASLRAEFLHDQHQSWFAGQPGPLDATGLQTIAQGFWTAFPDISHTIVSQLAENGTVFNHLKVKATHKGEFAGVKATNKSVEVEVMNSQRWVDGRLAEQRVQIDMVGLLQQLGALKG